MATNCTGIVKWFNTEKGFGLISQHQGPDIFVYSKNLVNSNGLLIIGRRRTLNEGEKVQFKGVRSLKGPSRGSYYLIAFIDSICLIDNKNRTFNRLAQEPS